MKKIFIGAWLSGLGTLSVCFQLCLGALFSINMQTWNYSKLWSALFDKTELDLLYPFCFSVFISLIGFIILLLEYRKK
ncbi:hypothetical protein AN641_01320 [Candidatus Epulonipiscioides gigas]|nr:hypothetical protein AN641_01320 [Epulopiscium sp. SCG-C07WGA-EpuloA2]